MPGRPGPTSTNRLEIIRVKGQPDFLLDVRESRHGPVLSDVQKSHGELMDTRKYVIALRWSALDADNQTVLAGLRANRAQSADEMVAAFAAYHSPMQNVVTADVAGGVAFKAVGKVPLRKPGNDIRGIAPSPGWEERYDWEGWLPYAQTPASRPRRHRGQRLVVHRQPAHHAAGVSLLHGPGLDRALPLRPHRATAGRHAQTRRRVHAKNPGRPAVARDGEAAAFPAKNAGAAGQPSAGRCRAQGYGRF
jgi:hypothetical protein